MKYFFIISSLIATVFCAPQATEHANIIQTCETSSGLSKDIIDVLWQWKIPEGLEKCHTECILAGFNWVSVS